MIQSINQSSRPGDLPLRYGGDDDATLPRPARYPGRPGSRSQPSRQEKVTGKRPDHWTYYTDEPMAGTQYKARRITEAQFDALATRDLRHPGCTRRSHAQVSSTPSRDYLDRSDD
jgi:hypothetical protein